MSAVPRAVGVTELAMRLLARSVPGAWFVLLAPEHDVERAAKAVAAEVAMLGNVPVTSVQPQNALDLARRVRVAGNIIVASGLDHFSDAEWARLDRLRSQLAHDRPVVAVMGTSAFEHLMDAAPNLASWLGGFVRRWDQSAEQLSPKETEARLRALRRWSGRSDEEVVALAEHGALPGDPAYAEWLVLMGRGDLLDR